MKFYKVVANSSDPREMGTMNLLNFLSKSSYLAHQAKKLNKLSKFEVPKLLYISQGTSRYLNFEQSKIIW